MTQKKEMIELKIRKYTNDLGKDISASEMYDALQEKYGEIFMLDLTHYILFSLANGLDNTCNALIKQQEVIKETIAKKKAESKVETPKILV